MTCIVGIADGENVWIGGDSAGTNGWLDQSIRRDGKVWRRDRRDEPWVFGFTSSYRMGQLVRHALTLPEPPEPEDDLHGWMVTTFIDAVRETLKGGGWLTTESGVESGGTFLVGVRGRLFTVHSDFQVAENDTGYGAVGCGENLALGALYATEGKRMSAKRRIEVALAAAEKFSAGVGGPMTIESLK